MARVVPIPTVLLMIVSAGSKMIDVTGRLADKILDFERVADVQDVDLLDPPDGGEISTPTVSWCSEMSSNSGFPTSPSPTTTTLLFSFMTLDLLLKK